MKVFNRVYEEHQRRVRRNNAFGFVMFVLVVVLFFWCMFAPLFAQTRTYTNADLGKKLPPVAASTSGDNLAGLRANQFQLLPVYDGPTAIIFSQREGSRLFDDPQYRLQQVVRAWPPAFYGGRYNVGKFASSPFTPSSDAFVRPATRVRYSR